MHRGSTVFTNQGYGTILDYKEKEHICNIKINNKLININSQEIHSHIPIKLLIIQDTARKKGIVYVPTNIFLNNLSSHITNSLGFR